ncbi:ArsR family transcriptional regulator [Natronorubrum sp. JWXQ-INN-674]|uniref:ArsR family transcriptional regulator n=1 Tax=Natronorubrum halalkaliphilum TaxID=2691917 RepID=A0A6B0VHJ6_9EURY|nr:ArsR family transcriptional regulator [Natronorubrum halalkaliphilum]MXV60964.1 ArsR family transcriptional regulator [Natronorubrum halalkaliphilum]
MDEAKRGVEAWKEHTTAFDRVRSIAEAVDRPRTAKYIAAEAAVSQTTAHEHLKRLAEMDVIRAVDGEDATRYEPDPLYARFRALRRLITDHDHEELLELKSDLQEQIEEFQEQYEVGSPETLREQAAETETAEETREYRKDASDWELALYHLSIANDAINNYREYADLDNRLHA